MSARCRTAATYVAIARALKPSVSGNAVIPGIPRGPRRILHIPGEPRLASSHRPVFEQPDEFRAVMVRHVLADTREEEGSKHVADTQRSPF